MTVQSPSSVAWSIGLGRLVLRQGDLSRAQVDAIVNAANPQLAGGGGVDGAIHRAAGVDELQAACREIIRKRGGPLKPGEAEPTPGFALPAKWIIHAVGPIWFGGSMGEPQALASAYQTSLRLAENLGAKDIAFPAISCGAYGYPVRLAAPLALGVVRDRLATGAEPATVYFYLYSPSALAEWRALAEEMLGPPNEA